MGNSLHNHENWAHSQMYSGDILEFAQISLRSTLVPGLHTQLLLLANYVILVFKEHE